MNKVSGFFVFEFMMYLLLFSILAVFLLYFMLRSTLFLREQVVLFNQKASLYVTLDIIDNILQAAPIDKNRYKCLRADCAIWHDSYAGCDVGLINNSRGLYYIKGVFNIVDQQWTRKRSNLIDKEVQEILFDYVFCQGAYNYLQAITVTVFLKDRKASKVIRCNQRVVV